MDNTHDTGLVARHEGYFEKITNSVDNIKEELRDYVKAPTFVVTLITTAIAIVSLCGWTITMMYGNIDVNQKNIMDIAKEQVRQEVTIRNVENNQKTYVAELIKALRDKK